MTAFVHLVEVFGRDDGTYVFGDVEDAIRFENAVNKAAGIDSPEERGFGTGCIRTEEVVCNASDTDALIEQEVAE